MVDRLIAQAHYCRLHSQIAVYYTWKSLLNMNCMKFPRLDCQTVVVLNPLSTMGLVSHARVIKFVTVFSVFLFNAHASNELIQTLVETNLKDY